MSHGIGIPFLVQLLRERKYHCASDPKDHTLLSLAKSCLTHTIEICDRRVVQFECFAHLSDRWVEHVEKELTVIVIACCAASQLLVVNVLGSAEENYLGSTLAILPKIRGFGTLRRKAQVHMLCVGFRPSSSGALSFSRRLSADAWRCIHQADPGRGRSRRNAPDSKIIEKLL